MIPTADVFAAIDRRVKAGRLSGVTSLSQFYRDDYHMGEAGRFVAASSVIVVNEIWRKPAVETAVGLAIIAFGLPVYWVLTKSRAGR